MGERDRRKGKVSGILGISQQLTKFELSMTSLDTATKASVLQIFDLLMNRILHAKTFYSLSYQHIEPMNR